MEKIRTHGRTFTGVVISDKMQKTVIVQWQIRKYLKKFERYIQQRVQVAAHNDIKAKEGDMVRIMETKPLVSHRVRYCLNRSCHSKNRSSS